MTDWLRAYCLYLPHTTEHVLWGDDLVFKIGGKMYAAAALSPRGHRMSFKCTPEEFAELTERPGIVPAPYSARMHWVALETEDALPRAEIKRLVKLSYDLVFAKLSKSAQSKLGQRAERAPQESSGGTGPSPKAKRPARPGALNR
jgi:predicted DNA-binding protein (MmcQ/YjbR family)